MSRKGGFNMRSRVNSDSLVVCGVQANLTSSDIIPTLAAQLEW